MRTIVAVLVVLLASHAAFAQRAYAIADQLDLSAKVNAKVVTVLKTYDAELTRLQDQRRDLRRRMIATRKDQGAVESLLDEALANQRALVAAEEKLVTRLRAVLTPSQVVNILVLLNASDPEGLSPEPDEPARRERTTASHDRDSLWPPGSAWRGTCDPFASMHGCLR